MPIPIQPHTSNLADWITKSTIGNIGNEKILDSVNLDNGNNFEATIDKITSIAKNKETLYIDKNSSEDKKREIIEYAKSNGVDNIVEVTEFEKNMTQKTKQPEVVEKPKPEKDPFNLLSNFSDEKNFKKDRSWEKVNPPNKLSNNTTGDTFVRLDDRVTSKNHREEDVKSNQNSIINPKNIEQNIENKTESNKSRILSGNKEKKDKISFNKAQWEKEKQPDNSSMLIKNTIKLTDAKDVNPHQKVASDQFSIFNDLSPLDKLENKTLGETIKTKESEKKSSIQREDTSQDKSWERVNSNKRSTISDELYNALKKRMK